MVETGLPARVMGFCAQLGNQDYTCCAVQRKKEIRENEGNLTSCYFKPHGMAHALRRRAVSIALIQVEGDQVGPAEQTWFRGSLCANGEKCPSSRETGRLRDSG